MLTEDYVMNTYRIVVARSALNSPLVLLNVENKYHNNLYEPKNYKQFRKKNVFL